MPGIAQILQGSGYPIGNVGNPINPPVLNTIIPDTTTAGQSHTYYNSTSGVTTYQFSYNGKNYTGNSNQDIINQLQSDLPNYAISLSGNQISITPPSYFSTLPTSEQQFIQTTQGAGFNPNQVLGTRYGAGILLSSQGNAQDPFVNFRIFSNTGGGSAGLLPSFRGTSQYLSTFGIEPTQETQLLGAINQYNAQVLQQGLGSGANYSVITSNPSGQETQTVHIGGSGSNAANYSYPFPLTVPTYITPGSIQTTVPLSLVPNVQTPNFIYSVNASQPIGVNAFDSSTVLNTTTGVRNVLINQATQPIDFSQGITASQLENLDLNALSQSFETAIKKGQTIGVALLPSEQKNIQNIINTVVNPIQNTTAKIQTLNDLFAPSTNLDVGGQTSQYLTNLSNEFNLLAKQNNATTSAMVGTSIVQPNNIFASYKPVTFPFLNQTSSNPPTFTNPVLGDIGEGIKAVGRGVVNLAAGVYLVSQLPNLIGATTNLPSTEQGLILSKAFSPSTLYTVTAAPLITGFQNKPVSTVLEIGGALLGAKAISSTVNYQYEPNTGVPTTNYINPLTKTTGEVVGAKVGTAVDLGGGRFIEIENIYDPTGAKIFDQSMTDVTKIGTPTEYKAPSFFTQMGNMLTGKPPEPTLNYQLLQTAGADISLEKSNIPTENYRFGERFEIYDEKGQLIFTNPVMNTGIGINNVALEESVSQSALVSRTETPVFPKDLQRIGFVNQQLTNPLASIDLSPPTAQEVEEASATNLIKPFQFGEGYGVLVKGATQDIGFQNGAFAQAEVLEDPAFQKLFHNIPDKMIKEELNTQNYGAVSIGNQNIIFERGSLTAKQIEGLSQAPAGTRILETSTFRYTPVETPFELRANYVNIPASSLQEIENAELNTFIKNENVLQQEGEPISVERIFKTEAVDVITPEPTPPSPPSSNTMTVGNAAFQEQALRTVPLTYIQPTFTSIPESASVSLPLVDPIIGVIQPTLSNQPLLSATPTKAITNNLTQPSTSLLNQPTTSTNLLNQPMTSTNLSVRPFTMTQPMTNTDLITQPQTDINLSSRLQPALQTQLQPQLQVQPQTQPQTFPITSLIGFSSPIAGRKKKKVPIQFLGKPKKTKYRPSRILPIVDLGSINASVFRFGKATAPKLTAQNVRAFEKSYARNYAFGTYPSVELMGAKKKQVRLI